MEEYVPGPDPLLHVRSGEEKTHPSACVRGFASLVVGRLISLHIVSMVQRG